MSTTIHAIEDGFKVLIDLAEKNGFLDEVVLLAKLTHDLAPVASRLHAPIDRKAVVAEVANLARSGGLAKAVDTLASFLKAVAPVLADPKSSDDVMTLIKDFM